MMLRARLLASASLAVLVSGSGAALAQARQPAQITTTPTTPQTFDILDRTGAWMTFGRTADTGWMGLGAALTVDQFGARGDFVYDDGPLIQKALNAARPGATVWLSPHPYWNKTQALVVPPGVSLQCMGAFNKFSPTSDYSAMPCTIYQKSGVAPLIYYGEIRNIGVLNDIAHFLPQATRAQMQAYVAAYAGVGVQAGLADTGASGSQAIAQNVMIGGFATCNKVNGAYQAQLRQVLGDCTNGLDLAGSFDNNFLSDIEYWQFLTTHKTFGTTSWSVSAVADNGAGSWRLTIAPSADPPQTGEKLWFFPGSGGAFTYPGASGAQGQWAVTGVDATHVDLQGSVTAPTTTGTTTAGRGYVAVASTDDLAPGMNVSGPGIPAGAKIAAVWRTRPAISLDQGHLATASASGVTLTFTNDPYAGSGGTLFYDPNYRAGMGFAVGHADGSSCSGCFAYGYLVGFNFRGGSFNNFTNSNVDGIAQAMANKNAVPIGVEFTNGANATYFQTSSLTSAGVHVLNDAGVTGAGGSNQVSIQYPTGSSQNATFLEHSTGGLAFADMSVSYGGAFLLDNSNPALAPISFMNVRVPNAALYSNAAAPVFTGAGNVFGGLLDQRVPTSHSAKEFFAAQSGGANYNYYDPAGAIDSKRWRTRAGASIWCVSAVNDAQDAAANALCIGRSGMGIVNASLSAALVVSNTITTAGYTINGTLPSCATAQRGMFAYVTNGQASPPYLGAATTTGTVVAPVFCNGVNWVYH